MSNSSSSSSSSSLCQLFQMYYTFNYYLCICPFKPVFDMGSTGCWTLRKNRVQQIFSVGVWLCVGACFLTSINIYDDYGFNWSSSQRSSTKYFQLIRVALDHWQTGLFLWSLHGSKGQLRVRLLLSKIASYDRARPPPPLTSSWTRNKLPQVGIMMSGILLSVVLATVVGIPFQKLSSKEGFQSVAGVAWKRFYHSQPYSNTNTSNSVVASPYSIENVIVASGSVTLDTIAYIQYSSLMLLLTIPVPLTVWLAISDFTKFVEEEATIPIPSGWKLGREEEEAAKVKDSILREFYRLKSLIDRINESYSLLMTVWIAQLMFEIVFGFQFGVDSGHVGYICFNLGCLLMLVCSLLISADVHRKGCLFKSWLSRWETRSKLWAAAADNSEYLAEWNDVKEAEVGVGIDGVYQISYSSVAQMLGLVITLFIVSFQ